MDKKTQGFKFSPLESLIANHLLSKVGGETIFHANLSISEKFRQRMYDLSLFYRELVLAWEKFSVCKNLAGSQISTQSLWNNKFIHSKSTSLYDDSLVSKGIIYVSNLFDRKGEMKNWETVSQEFNLNPVHFLKWYGVIKSIPSCWKKALRSHSVEESITGDNTLCGAFSLVLSD